MPRRLTAPLVALVLAGACATPGRPGGEVPRALAPVSVMEARAFEQVMTVTVDGEVRRFRVVGRICDGLVLALFTAEGLDLLRIRHDDDGGVEMERRQDLPDAINAHRILADLQLVYWPPAALERTWSGGWRIASAGGERRLHYRGRSMATVTHGGDPWEGTVMLAHHGHGYTLEIHTLSHRPLDADAGCRPGGTGAE